MLQACFLSGFDLFFIQFCQGWVIDLVVETPLGQSEDHLPPFPPTTPLLRRHTTVWDKFRPRSSCSAWECIGVGHYDMTAPRKFSRSRGVTLIACTESSVGMHSQAESGNGKKLCYLFHIGYCAFHQGAGLETQAKKMPKACQADFLNQGHRV